MVRGYPEGEVPLHLAVSTLDKVALDFYEDNKSKVATYADLKELLRKGPFSDKVTTYGTFAKIASRKSAARNPGMIMAMIREQRKALEEGSYDVVQLRPQLQAHSSSLSQSRATKGAWQGQGGFSQARRSRSTM